MSSRILIIDSEPGIRELLDITLDLDGHTVLQARSEYEALVQLTSEPAIDAIILGDLEPVPQTSQQLLRDLRQDESLSAVPILVLSTQVRPVDRQLALTNGATAWLAKPFAITQVITAIQELRPKQASA